MNFEEALDPALMMFHRRGRVTYQTLKLQFELDDDHLEALKDERLYSQPQVVDDKDRGLIWAGGSEMPSPARASELTPVHTIQWFTPDESASLSPTAPEAERRQLTVMFCDLVDSICLAGQLDPKELCEVIRVYQESVPGAIEYYWGHIA